MGPCEVAGTVEKARCGTLDVAENRGAGDGRRIPLKIVVIPARSEKPAPDPLFIIPGGPGQSATEFAGYLLRDLGFAHETRDLVFVDQRGTGGSNPLRCGLGNTLGELVRLLSVGVDADLDAVRACRRELEERADLRFYTTSIAMEDLDEVRAALGYERINLFAVSYGTRAALVYMRRYPSRVRSAILRAVGSVDVRLPLTVAIDSQRALDRLFATCAKDEDCREAFPDPVGQLRTVLKRLAASPVTVSVNDPRTGSPVNLRIDADVFGTGLFFLLYVTEWARHIPMLVHAAAQGNLQPFASLIVPVFVGTATPVYWGMRRAVLCAEDAAGLTGEDVERAAGDTLAGTTANLGLLASCREWPVGTLPEGYTDPIRSDVPVLAISGEEDPVLPPSRAEGALAHLPNSFHVIVPATAHGPNFPACVRDLARDFLEDASADNLDDTCVEDIKRPSFTLPR
jgi:pimeloyl-ACP methyl ester carboxylesterase